MRSAALAMRVCVGQACLHGAVCAAPCVGLARPVALARWGPLALPPLGKDIHGSLGRVPVA